MSTPEARRIRSKKALLPEILRLDAHLLETLPFEMLLPVIRRPSLVRA
jgi:hypothetical protein